MDSPCFWIKFQLVCLLFTPILTITIVALVDRVPTLLNRILQSRSSYVSPPKRTG